MTDPITNEVTQNWIAKLAREQGAGWVFSGALLYACWVMVCDVMDRSEKQLDAITSNFATELLKISENNLKAAQTRENVIDKVIQQFRQDETEDRRLFVEIIRRSNMTSQDLREAVEAANVAQPKVPLPNE